MLHVESDPLHTRVQHLGYTNVGRLQGGIINYVNHVRRATGPGQEAPTADAGADGEGAVVPGSLPPPLPASASLFRGRNFVFDQRLTVAVTADELGACAQCGAACGTYRNCAFTLCHTRMLQCTGCHAAHAGCCSTGCQKQVGQPIFKYLSHDTTTAINPRDVATAVDSLDAASAGSVPPPLGRLGAMESVSLNRLLDAAMDAFHQVPGVGEGAGTRGPPEENEEPGGRLPLLRVATTAAFPRAAHMACSAAQGRLLACLLEGIGARRVLELGTFTGCGTLALARAATVREVVTCDRHAEALALAREALAGSDVTAKVRSEPAAGRGYVSG